ncbi:MAG TPA: hypothetical protein VEI02_10520 [Planctomycetota bacterium]|nr:hypothetical protein [Planctomycetota bacterium]
MEVKFERVFEGKRLFQVVGHDGETSLFTGTNAQCKRFIEVYLEKLERDRKRDRRPRRSAASR